MVKELLWLAAAGAAGTLSRFGLSGLVQWVAGAKFPWGTLAVNVLGCFFFGLIWMLSEERLVLRGQYRFILLVGFMGAFTTFSTFAFETSSYLRDWQWPSACWNLLANNVVCIFAVFCGFAVGRWL